MFFKPCSIIIFETVEIKKKYCFSKFWKAVGLICLSPLKRYKMHPDAVM